MIVTFQDVVQDAVEKTFDSWTDDPDRTLAWGMEPVDAMVPCHGDCADADLYEGDDETVRVHPVVGLRITLALMTGGTVGLKQGVVFTVTLQQALGGDLADLLEQVRVEFDFSVQTGSLDDTEERMRKIASAFQEHQ